MSEMKKLIEELSFNIEGIKLAITDKGRAAFIQSAKELIERIKVQVDNLDVDLEKEQPTPQRKSGSYLTFILFFLMLGFSAQAQFKPKTITPKVTGYSSDTSFLPYDMMYNGDTLVIIHPDKVNFIKIDGQVYQIVHKHTFRKYDPERDAMLKEKSAMRKAEAQKF